MLDRLKKTVTSVIGNPVCRDYEFTVQTGTCGPGGLWKIYDGRKRSTGQVGKIGCQWNGGFITETNYHSNYPSKQTNNINLSTIKN